MGCDENLGKTAPRDCHADAAMTTPKIFLSAGEASGELYGALLIDALRRLAPQAECFGLGGRRMERSGFRAIVRDEDVAVMGITEVVRHMPRIYSSYRKLRASLIRERPDVAILIDFPDVNLRLAETLRRLEIPVVYLVGPQLWAWKPWRIRRIRDHVTRMLVIFPFEEPYYRSRGVEAEFIGHPLADLDPPRAGREEFARENRLDASKTWVGLLPGSREKVVRAHLLPMLGAARLLGAGYEYLLPVASTLKLSGVETLLKSMVPDGLTVRAVPDARGALHLAAASIVSSGTATVEAALIGNPFLVVYRVAPLSYAIARRVVRVDHVAMVNLIAGRRIVPELIQNEFTAANAAAGLRPLLEDRTARETMQAELRSVGGALCLPADERGRTAIERAARIVLDCLPGPAKTRLQPAVSAALPGVIEPGI